MAARVLLTGYTEGLRKVSLDLLLNRTAGVPLRQAKQHVNDLIDGQTVVIVMSTY